MSTPNSQLIHLYLDGELSTNLERHLFDELASNEELRRQFGSELALHKAATADMATIVPPENLRASVFSILDIPTVSETPEAITAIAHTSRFLTFGAVALFSMIIGGAAVWLGLSYNNSNIGQIQTPEIKTIQSFASASPIMISPSSPPEAVPKSAHLYSKSFHKNIAQQYPTLFDEIKRQAPEISNNELIAHEPNTAIEIQTSVLLNDSEQSYSHIQSSSVAPNMFSVVEDNGLLPDVPFYLQTQRISSFGGIRSGSAYTVSAMYELDSENSLGVEFSNDNFSYSTTRLLNGDIQSYNISVQAVALGAAYRLEIPSIGMEDFVPYLQSFAGATVHGLPVARTALGMTWTPDSRVTLSGGIDATVFSFFCFLDFTTNFPPVIFII
ncbi:MAG: hypothetical protein HYZ54_03240 [Ignavibacteriae bacterium]|nr:hypothetical protein [Ignavibacteriota bacterium]